MSHADNISPHIMRMPDAEPLTKREAQGVIDEHILGGMEKAPPQHHVPLPLDHLEERHILPIQPGNPDGVIDMISDARTDTPATSPMDTHDVDAPLIDTMQVPSTKETPTISTDAKTYDLAPARQVQVAVEKYALEDGMQRFTVDLNPRELGKVKVEVTFDSRDNSRHISIRTETPEALQALKESSEWLRLNLASDDSGATTSFEFSQETADDQPGFQAGKKKNGSGNFEADSATTNIILPSQNNNLHLLHEVV